MMVPHSRDIGFVRGGMDKLGTERRRGVVRVSFWKYYVDRDGPATNDPCPMHNQPSVDDASFSMPCHQVADAGQRVQDLECAGHQSQEVVEVRDVAEVPMQKSLPFSLH